LVQVFLSGQPIQRHFDINFDIKQPYIILNFDEQGLTVYSKTE